MELEEVFNGCRVHKENYNESEDNMWDIIINKIAYKEINKYDGKDLIENNI